MNSKTLGFLIVIISVLTIGLLIFSKIQTDRQSLQACTEICGSAGIDAAACPYHEQNSQGWIAIISSILVAALGGVGLYLAFSKTEKVIEHKEYDISSLNDEEKNVFLLVKENKEGVYQSELVTKTTLSKVKMTRILDSLEAHGLVERKRRGMSNVVVLK